MVWGSESFQLAVFGILPKTSPQCGASFSEERRLGSSERCPNQHSIRIFGVIRALLDTTVRGGSSVAVAKRVLKCGCKRSSVS